MAMLPDVPEICNAIYINKFKVLLLMWFKLLLILITKRKGIKNIVLTYIFFFNTC